jgi:hypothetical protein
MAKMVYLLKEKEYATYTEALRFPITVAEILGMSDDDIYSADILLTCIRNIKSDNTRLINQLANVPKSEEVCQNMLKRIATELGFGDGILDSGFIVNKVRIIIQQKNMYKKQLSEAGLLTEETFDQILTGSTDIKINVEGIDGNTKSA